MGQQCLHVTAAAWRLAVSKQVKIGLQLIWQNCETWALKTIFLGGRGLKADPPVHTLKCPQQGPEATEDEQLSAHLELHLV